MFIIAVVTHLISYNAWRLFDTLEKQEYAYWILNSLTHNVYSLSLYYLTVLFDRKLNLKQTFALRMFAADWCMYGAIDLYNQWNRRYNTEVNPQWILFLIVIVFNSYRIIKWKYKQNNRQ